MNSFLVLSLGLGMATLSALLFLTDVAKAETLDTPLFSVEVPFGWTVTRNNSGLWEITSDQPFEQKNILMVSRLLVDVNTYLQGTSRLWGSLGQVEYVAGPDQFEENLAHFEIRSPQDSEHIISKFVKWNGSRLLVVSSTFPVKHSKEATDFVSRFTRNIVLKEPVFEPKALESFISSQLERHSEQKEELEDLVALRREMASFRQDWESLFVAEPPLVFTAYRKYLEARYEAGFAKVRGEELGMPSGAIAERMEALEARKQELLLVMGWR